MSTEFVKLKDGNEVHRVVVTALTLSLRSLTEDYPVALYELREKCRDRNHVFFGSTEDVLKERALVESDGSIRDIIRLVVLNTIEGEMMEMKLVSPLHPDQPDLEQPEIVNPGVAISDLDLFNAIHRIGAIVEEEIRRYQKSHPGKVSYRMRDDDCNPWYNQTQQGLFLEYYYSSPSKVWTPWGYWDFEGLNSHSGDADVEGINAKILERLGAKIYQEEKNTVMGCVGPVYAIYKVDELVLPDPQVRQRHDYIAYEECREAWKRLESQSKQSR